MGTLEGRTFCWPHRTCQCCHAAASAWASQPAHRPRGSVFRYAHVV